MGLADLTQNRGFLGSGLRRNDEKGAGMTVGAGMTKRGPLVRSPSISLRANGGARVGRMERLLWRCVSPSPQSPPIKGGGILIPSPLEGEG